MIRATEKNRLFLGGKPKAMDARKLAKPFKVAR
jgi:hypothetical protein